MSTYLLCFASISFFISHYPLPYLHKFYGKVARISPDIVSVADKDMIKEVRMMNRGEKSHGSKAQKSLQLKSPLSPLFPFFFSL